MFIDSSKKVILVHPIWLDVYGVILISMRCECLLSKLRLNSEQ